jgi:hypothetical protein
MSQIRQKTVALLMLVVGLGVAQRGLSKDREIPIEHPGFPVNPRVPLSIPLDPVVKLHANNGTNYCVQRLSGKVECFGNPNGDDTGFTGEPGNLNESHYRFKLPTILQSLADQKKIAYLRTSYDGQMALTTDGNLIFHLLHVQLVDKKVVLNAKIGLSDIDPNNQCLVGPRGKVCFYLRSLQVEAAKTCVPQFRTSDSCLISWDELYRVSRTLPSEPFDQISVGGRHYCTLTSGRVRCYRHQLPSTLWSGPHDPIVEVAFGEEWSASSKTRQLQSDLSSGVVSLSNANLVGRASSFDNFCAMKPGKIPICWSFGLRPADGRSTVIQAHAIPGEEPWRFPVGLPPMTKIITTQYHHCGITIDRRVTCWSNHRRLFSEHARWVESQSVDAPSYPEELSDVEDIIFFSTMARGVINSDYGGLCALSKGRVYCFGFLASLEGAPGGSVDPIRAVEKGWAPKIWPPVE